MEKANAFKYQVELLEYFTDMSEMESGVFLMVIGMAVVTLFLTLLILMISAIHWVDEKFFPEKATATAGTTDGRLVAVITAAVQQHIRNRK